MEVWVSGLNQGFAKPPTLFRGSAGSNPAASAKVLLYVSPEESGYRRFVENVHKWQIFQEGHDYVEACYTVNR